MRGQAGTPDLRALAYMDEVFGYVPPTASPPPKKPILTILKQGRAFGLGLVLSTQNPVDLDYKAMSNAGTWLVGRLQTENDKARVLEGLRSAAGGTDVAALDAAIGALGKRQFLLVSAKASQPRLLATRWAMSYLAGPLTKEQVERARAAGRDDAPRRLSPPRRRPAEAPPQLGSDETGVAPPVAAGVTVSYLDPAAPWAAQIGASRARRGCARSSPPASRSATTTPRRTSTSSRSSRRSTARSTAGSTSRARRWSTTTTATSPRLPPRAPPTSSRRRRSARSGSSSRPRSEIQRHLVDRRALELQRNRALKLVSRPGETPEEFAVRCRQAAQQRADAEAAKIRDRLEAKQDRLQKALEQAQRRVEELDTDTRSRQANEVIAGAGAVLGALLGGRRSTRSITSALGGAASRRGMTARTAERRETAAGKVESTTEDLAELEQEILDEVAEIDERWRETAAEIDTVSIRLEATDVRVVETRLVWVPSD